MSEFVDPTSSISDEETRKKNEETHDDEQPDKVEVEIEVEEEESEKQGTADAISADIAYVKANIVKAAVLTVTRDYITVVIM